MTFSTKWAPLALIVKEVDGFFLFYLVIFQLIEPFLLWIFCLFVCSHSKGPRILSLRLIKTVFTLCQQIFLSVSTFPVPSNDPVPQQSVADVDSGSLRLCHCNFRHMGKAEWSNGFMQLPTSLRTNERFSPSLTVSRQWRRRIINPLFDKYLRHTWENFFFFVT